MKVHEYVVLRGDVQHLHGSHKWEVSLQLIQAEFAWAHWTSVPTCGIFFETLSKMGIFSWFQQTHKTSSCSSTPLYVCLVELLVPEWRWKRGGSYQFQLSGTDPEAGVCPYTWRWWAWKWLLILTLMQPALNGVFVLLHIYEWSCGCLSGNASPEWDSCFSLWYSNTLKRVLESQLLC